MKRFYINLSIVLLSWACAVVGGTVFAKHPRVYPPVPASQPATKPITHAAPKFVVGFCQVPVENIPVVKALGGNTCIGIPANRDKIDWARKMTDAGVYQIRPPVGSKDLDADNPYWICVENPDEPDLHGTPIAEIKANHDLAASLGMPTFTNIDGSRLLGIQAAAPGTDYQAIVDNSDWLCADIYPVAGWSLNVSIWTPGQASDKLLEMGKGKPVLQYVECSKQMQWRQSTVAEMQLILRQATSRNLRGVVFFTFDFQSNGLGWDGAPSHFFNVDSEHCVEIADFAEKQNK